MLVAGHFSNNGVVSAAARGCEAALLIHTGTPQPSIGAATACWHLLCRRLVIAASQATEDIDSAGRADADARQTDVSSRIARVLLQVAGDHVFVCSCVCSFGSQRFMYVDAVMVILTLMPLMSLSLSLSLFPRVEKLRWRISPQPWETMMAGYR